MNEDTIQTLKRSISAFCHERTREQPECCPDDCEFCPMQRAYDMADAMLDTNKEEDI